MRIFEKVRLTDGGPNDRGKVIGYFSIKHDMLIPTSNNPFVEYREISVREYNKRKNEALRALDLFTI